MGDDPASPMSSVPSPKKAKGESGVKVMVRVRPFNSREKAISAERDEPLRCVVDMQGSNCIILNHLKDYEPHESYQAFVFDECLWSMPEDEWNPMSENGFADQAIVYQKGGAEALENAKEGYNTCIFAYGQTGAGKSFSMLGAPGMPGISPQLITNLFKYIDEQKAANPKTKFKVATTFFEIYMEKVKDLFTKGKSGDYAAVKIRQHPLYGIQVHGLETLVVESEQECAERMDYGVSQRSLASTKMNATSSRSHAIFQIHIHINDVLTKSQTTATINLVDLAGSERIGKTGATGQTKEEGMAINLSLSTLRKVMDALVDNAKGKKIVPPYRESMLTWVLKESLGGNSKTIMITAISPHYDNIEDTISTLRYGLKAKAIVNKAVKQETSANKHVKQMQDEITRLQEQLKEQQSAGTADPEVVQELQEQMEMMQEAEAKAKEELQEMEALSVQLQQQMQELKKRQFAQAFRAAFSKGELKRDTEKQEQEVKELRAKVDEMDAGMEPLRQEVAEAQAKCQQMTKQLTEAVEDKKAVTQRLEELGRKMKEDTAAVEEEAQRVKGKLQEELYEERKKLSTQLEDERSKAEAAQAQARRELEQSRDSARRLQQRATELEEQIAQEREEAARAQQRLADAGFETRKVEQQAAELRDEIARKEREAAETRSALEAERKTRQHIESLRSNTDGELKLLREQAERERRRMDEELTSLRGRLEEQLLESERDRARAEEEARARIAQLEGKGGDLDREVRVLQERAGDRERQVRELQGRLQETEDKLRQEVQNSQQQVADARAEVVRAQIEVQRAEQARKAAEEQRAADRADLQDALMRTEQRYAAQEADSRQQLQRAADAAREREAQLAEQLAALRSDKAALQERVRASSDSDRELQAAVEELRLQLSSERDRRAAEQDKVQQAEGRCTQLQESCREHERRSQAVRAELQQALQNAADLDGRVKDLEHALRNATDAAELRLQEEGQKRKIAEKQIGSLHEDVARLEDEVDALGQELGQEKKKAQGRLFVAAQKEEELNREVESLRNQLEMHARDSLAVSEEAVRQRELAVAEAEAAAQRRQQGLTERVGTLEQQCEQLEDRLRGMRTERDALAAAHADSERQCRELHVALTQLKSKVQSLEVAEERAKEEIADRDRRLQAQQEDRAQLQSALAAEDQRRREAERAAASALHEARLMREKVGPLEEQREKRAAQINELIATNRKLTRDHREEERLRREAETKMLAMRVALGPAEEKVQDLEERNACLERQLKTAHAEAEAQKQELGAQLWKQKAQMQSAIATAQRDRSEASDLVSVRTAPSKLVGSVGPASGPPATTRTVAASESGERTEQLKRELDGQQREAQQLREQLEQLDEHVSKACGGDSFLRGYIARLEAKVRDKEHELPLAQRQRDSAEIGAERAAAQCQRTEAELAAERSDRQRAWRRARALSDELRQHCAAAERREKQFAREYDLCNAERRRLRPVAELSDSTSPDNQRRSQLPMSQGERESLQLQLDRLVDLLTPSTAAAAMLSISDEAASAAASRPSASVPRVSAGGGSPPPSVRRPLSSAAADTGPVGYNQMLPPATSPPGAGAAGLSSSRQTPSAARAGAALASPPAGRSPSYHSCQSSPLPRHPGGSPAAAVPSVSPGGSGRSGLSPGLAFSPRPAAQEHSPQRFPSGGYSGAGPSGSRHAVARTATRCSISPRRDRSPHRERFSAR